jgi:hypothetical protein
MSQPKRNWMQIDEEGIKNLLMNVNQSQGTPL